MSKISTTIDLAFTTLQEAYDSATEAEEWFYELYVSQEGNVFKVTDFKPGGLVHLTLINNKINLITSESKKLV